MKFAMLSAVLVWSSCMSAPSLQLPGAPPAHPLPLGKLQMVSGNKLGINFVELGSSSKSGDIADVWTYRPFAKPVQLKALRKVFVVADTIHQRINCAHWTVKKLSMDGYDNEGTRVVFLPPSPASKIDPVSDEDLLAGAFCKSVQLPPQNTVIGYVQANSMARYMFEHHLTQ